MTYVPNRVRNLIRENEQLKRQLAEAVPVVVVSEEIWRELGQPTNLAEVFDALEVEAQHQAE